MSDNIHISKVLGTSEQLGGNPQFSQIDNPTPSKKHKIDFPDQPLYKDEHGVVRFKANKIVRFLLDAGPFDMNRLAVIDFTDEDRAQFAQLIGYSLGGYSELASYVSDGMYERADNTAKEQNLW